ncbi:MAG TPA: hypothetical protein VGM27_26670 [Acidobacteriaceae bacterium]|jgi:hypothetical protein
MATTASATPSSTRTISGIGVPDSDAGCAATLDKRWTRILLPLSATTIVVAGATLTKEPKAKLRGDELLPPDSG